MATILIVEDRPPDQVLLASVLRAAGHFVLSSDGADALEILQAQRVDLVISEILTRTICGYELAGRARDLTGAAAPPIVFYTDGYHEREARSLARDCGAVAVLTRPSRPEGIVAMVERALRSPLAAEQPGEERVQRADVQAGQEDLGRSRLSALMALAQRVAAARDPEALLRLVAGAARDIIFARQAVIGLLDGEGAVGTTVTSGASVGTFDAADPSELGEPLWKQALAERRPVRSAGTFQAAPGAPSQGVAASLLTVPIASPNRVFGFLTLRHKLGADQFSDADEEVALTLGAHTAVAYENARLYADLRQNVAALEREVVDRRHAEEALRHRARLAMFSSAIGHALTSSATVSGMLQAAVDAAVEHLDAVVARIWILNTAADDLGLAATAGTIEMVSAPPVPLAGPGVAAVARARTATVTDPLQDEPFPGDSSWLAPRGVTTFGGWPLIVDARLLGVLGIYGAAPLSEEAFDTIASASTQIALGVERRQVETRLREGEERTRFALGTARMGIWELDLARNTLLSADTLRPLFGMEPGTAVPELQTLLARIHVDDRAMVMEELERSIAARRDYAVGFRVRWPDGTLHWIDGRGHFLYDDNGVPVRVLGVSIDVSDRKALEEQLLQAQKMEGIGQLAGGVAHDFNNLLTAILGYSALLEDSLALDDPRRLDVEEIVKATDRASALTRQLLAFSRKQLLEPTLVQLNDLIREMSQMLKRLISEDIELHTSLAPHLLPIRADAGQLQQVVMNLAVNARDAMPTGGRLTIETANVDLDAAYLLHHAVTQAGRYVMVAVSDTGHGIPDLVKARLFEPFFTTKEKGRGTGLGLATVYGIVQQSGGYIWVYSEPGHGATFKVYLPATDNLADVVPVASESRAARGHEVVAIVEDEEAVRRLACVVLSRAGYQVVEAADPHQAQMVVEARGEPIDLLVTDVVMPGSSGPALYQRLLARQPTLRVLYMSGYTDDAVIREGRLEPGAAFLQKPFTGERLLRKVRDVLDR